MKSPALLLSLTGLMAGALAYSLRQLWHTSKKQLQPLRVPASLLDPADQADRRL